MQKSTGPRRLYFTLTMGLLCAAVLYGWYVWASYTRLNDFNQRQLAKTAAELKSTIKNAVETITRFNPRDETALCNFDVDQPYLVIVPATDCRGLPGRLRNPTVTAALTIKATATNQSADQPPPDHFQNEVTFAVQTGAVLRELPFPESFPLLFIADENGHVLYEDAPSRQGWVNHLRWGERRFRDSGAGRYEGLKLRTLENVFGDDKASGWPRLQSMSGRTTLSLGGQYHEIYLEPFTIENQEENVGFLLGAAVPTQTIVTQALAVDSVFLAILVLIVAVAGLGFPFVKLMALDRHERFRMGDVISLFGSTAALLALATLMIQALATGVLWEQVADEGMTQLGERIEQAFRDEVTVIRHLAGDYDKEVARWQKRPDRKRERAPGTNWYGAPNPEIPAPEGAMIYQASWIDPKGDQVWKITDDPTTSWQSVSQRVYFQAVRDGYVFECEQTSPCGHPARPFYIGPDRSVTDGKFYTFIAVPSGITDAKDVKDAKDVVDAKDAADVKDAKEPDAGRYVLSLTARLFSLSTNALPAGYGFAVINRAGRVLYHSDPRLALREYLFEELGAGEHVRAVVYAGRTQTVTSTYRETPHRLHFRPVALGLAGGKESGALYYVVTFRDVSLDRTLVARAFLTTLGVTVVAFALFIGGALTIMARISTARGQHWSAWLWPHGGMDHVYKAIAASLWALLVVSVIAGVAGASEDWFVVVPVVASGLAIGLYAVRARPGNRRKLDSPIWYSAMFVLLLITIVIFPAWSVFRAAMGYEFGKRIATERDWIDAQRADLPIELEAELREDERPRAMIDRMVTLRKQALDRFTAPAPFDAVPEAAQSALLLPFRWADDLWPIENDTAARVRYGAVGTYLPAASWLSFSGWGLLGLIAVVTAIVWWMRWKAIRLFFADHNPEPRRDHETPAALWDACTPEEHLVLIRIADDHVANPKQRHVVERLMERGLLTLDPDLQLSTPELAAYVKAQQKTMKARLDRWEAVESTHSWRYARIVLVGLIAVIALFVVATQPAMQTALVGLAGGLAGLLTAGLKLRDSVLGWLERRAKA